MKPATSLLHELVSFPSVSGDEYAIAEFLSGWLKARGLPVHLDDRNLAARVGREGPTLLLNSHLDVVPVGEGWATDPFVPLVKDGRMFGRGSNDAKASVAAMALAMTRLAERPPEGVQVVFAATCEEERGRGGLEVFLPQLGHIDAAVVGEPTGLHPAVAQNGLLILELFARGKAGHAARPHLAKNAIDIAAGDVAALHGLQWQPHNPHVGPMTLAVTQIEAGRAHNVIPEVCKMVVDIRTIPEIPPEVVVERVRSVVQSEVRVRSDRFRPVHTPHEDRLVEAVREAHPEGAAFGSPTLSDWAHLAHIPAVKLGPGLSEVSHTANEWVDLAEVERAVGVYEGIVRAWARSAAA